MDFPDPLVRGTLERRYKRFMADVKLDTGETVTAHCANTGAMTGLCAPGSEVWLSPARNPDRKLKFSWELVRDGDTLVGVNTAHPNRIVAEAIAAQRVAPLARYRSLRREVRYGENSRIDILLQDPERGDCYVEVKNVHLRREGRAEFPDAVTARGAKHLAEMARLAAAGTRAVTLYLVQRQDCRSFAIAADIDPAYAAALAAAREQGVETLCYTCSLTTAAIELDHPLPLDL